MVRMVCLVGARFILVQAERPYIQSSMAGVIGGEVPGINITVSVPRRALTSIAWVSSRLVVLRPL
jgi:hypothetical protein